MYDIFFIVYDVKSVKDKIRARFPLAKFCIVDDNKTIKDAVFDAQKRSMTKMFWLIDIGHEVKDTFDLDYQVSDWDQDYVHVFKEEKSENFESVYLIPKTYHISKNEAEHLFFINKKEIDVIASYKKDPDIFFAIYDVQKTKDQLSLRFPAAEFCIVDDNITIKDALYDAQQRASTEMFWLIDIGHEVKETFDIDYKIPEWDQNYVHVFKEEKSDLHNGMYLIPKTYHISKNEAEHLFFINKKEIDVIASYKKDPDIFFAIYDVQKTKDRLKSKFPTAEFCIINNDKTIKDALYDAQQRASTEMFWLIDIGHEVKETFDIDYKIPEWDQNYVHVFKEEKSSTFGGMYLIPKTYHISKNEAAHLFFINKKEIDTVASYKKDPDIFFAIYDVQKTKDQLSIRFPAAEFCIVDDNITIKDALYDAQQRASTEVFWLIDIGHEVKDTFDLDYQVSDWDQDYVHVFKEEKSDLHNGMYLIPKTYHISKNEAEHLFFINKKEIDVIASYKKDPDIFFAIYDVQKTKDYLRSKFPTSEFCIVDDNVTIKDALYDAQQRASTEMFWLIDIGHEVKETFDIDYKIPDWDQDYVHVFKEEKSKIFGGMYLIPKTYHISKNEAEHLFFINKKEVDVIASYKKDPDIFFITHESKKVKNKIKLRFPTAGFCTVNENNSVQKALYDAQQRASTEMFWLIDIGHEVKETFDIDYKVPDWDQNYVHVFKEEKSNIFGGMYLIPKTYHISKNEAEHLFFINKKEVDVIASKIINYDVFTVKDYNDYLNSKKETTTDMFYVVYSDLKLVDDFKFDHVIDKNLQHLNYVFKNGNFYDGVFLTSKKQTITEKEFNNRFLINRTEVDEQASIAEKYETVVCDSYDDYLEKRKTIQTSMVYVVTPDIQITEFNFDYQVPKWNQDKVHVFKNGEYFDGICLFPTNKIISSKEFNTKQFDIKINVDIVASTSKKYEIHFLSSYDEYQNIKNKVETDMFYFVNDFVKLDTGFKFDYQIPKWDQDKVHVFKNGEYFDGICIFPKNRSVTQREFDYKFFINKIEVDIEASTPKLFDIVFISYSESNADENYHDLIERFPRAKRIHGVKGIHQAHIEAAKIVETPMFWVVDGDAQILKTFNFDHQVPVWNYDTVHVWRSQNPVNGLQYGYGGVKLLPTLLTKNLDISSVDMTTSISSKFKPVPVTSNISKFNINEFDTWKSAFRECVKLSSRIISGQNDKESLYRLDVWCTEGEQEDYGKFAIDGAKMGKDFGFKYKDNPEMLSKINDWEWLKNEFQIYTGSRC